MYTDLLKWDEVLKTDKLISQAILSQSFLRYHNQ
jgi:hypothetical protein